MDANTGIKIPADRLSPETLREVIEEFVTRDGTDLADTESKIREVQVLLERGEVEIWFDENTRSCSIFESER